MEGGVVTRAVACHFGGGMAFFSGAVLALVAVGICRVGSVRWVRRARGISAGTGLVLVALSACPLPIAAYAILAIATALAVAAAPQRTRSAAARVTLQIVAAVAWSAAIVAELPFHITPRLQPVPDPVLGIIGDSLTAGMGEMEAITWPNLLRQEHGLRIADHSAMGATLASAQRQADALDDSENVVLLAIGGNDLLGGTSAAEFEERLRALLQRVCRPGRTVAMLELPLPPLYNAFGSVQRRLAHQYNVPLVPKRALMTVLCAKGSTLDSIHLSQAGHERMARTIWEALRGAFDGRGERGMKNEE